MLNKFRTASYKKRYFMTSAPTHIINEVRERPNCSTVFDVVRSIMSMGFKTEILYDVKEFKVISKDWLTYNKNESGMNLCEATFDKHYFVTSNKSEETMNREYTIRRWNSINGMMDLIGIEHQYKHYTQAKYDLNKLLKELEI